MIQTIIIIVLIMATFANPDGFMIYGFLGLLTIATLFTESNVEKRKNNNERKKRQNIKDSWKYKMENNETSQNIIKSISKYINENNIKNILITETDVKLNDTSIPFETFSLPPLDEYGCSAFADELVKHITLKSDEKYSISKMVESGAVHFHNTSIHLGTGPISGQVYSETLPDYSEDPEVFIGYQISIYKCVENVNESKNYKNEW